MTKKPLLGLAAAVAASAVVLAGCAGSTPATEADRSFVIGAGDVESIDAITFKSNFAATINANVYAGPLEQQFEEADGYLMGLDEFEPHLLESIEWNDDETVATLTLVEGLTFADGEPLDSSDLAYTLRRTLGDASYVSGSNRLFMRISDPEAAVAIVDESTVAVTLDAPSAAFERFLSLNTYGIVNAEIAEANAGDDGWAKEFFSRNATDSGPFAIDSWDFGQTMILTKNDNYLHADEVWADSVTIQNIPDVNQRYLAVANGDIDIAMDLPPQLLVQAESNPALKVTRMPSAELTYLGMNNAVAPFDNPLVRRAISYAIPYETIRDEVMLGYAGGAYGAVTSTMETSLALDAETGAYDTDLDEARDLLAQAGVGDISVPLTVRSSVREYVDAATYIQEALAEVGITVQIVLMDDAEYQTALTNKEIGFFFAGWSSWGEDPFFQIRALFETGRVTNPVGYSNPKVDAAIAAGIQEADPELRQQISAEAQQIIIDEAPVAFLYVRDQPIVSRVDVSGFTRTVDGLLRLKFLTRE